MNELLDALEESMPIICGAIFIGVLVVVWLTSTKDDE